MYNHLTWHLRSMGSQNSSLSVKVCMSAHSGHAFCPLTAIIMCKAAENTKMPAQRAHDSKPKDEGVHKVPCASK